MDRLERVEAIPGPIVILGAGGFIGSNLLRMLLAERSDVVGVVRSDCSRLVGLKANLLRMHRGPVSTEWMMSIVGHTGTIINCAAYGAYSWQTDADEMYRTNYGLPWHLLTHLPEGVTYIHAGSSSEYGTNCEAPDESANLFPNSNYATTKAMASRVIEHAGRCEGKRVCNLRLYSVYGPYEDERRLIPSVVRHGLEGTLPEFVHPEISRDFVYITDACQAFVDAAVGLKREDYGASFNIGTGVRMTIGDVAKTAQRLFGITEEPRFTMQPRQWDLQRWYANPARAKARLGWEARVSFAEGLTRTIEWEQKRRVSASGDRRTHPER